MTSKLDEDIWYILNDKVDGVEPRGKSKEYENEMGYKRARRSTSGTPQLLELAFQPR